MLAYHNGVTLQRLRRSWVPRRNRMRTSRFFAKPGRRRTPPKVQPLCARCAWARRARLRDCHRGAVPRWGADRGQEAASCSVFRCNSWASCCRSARKSAFFVSFRTPDSLNKVCGKCAVWQQQQMGKGNRHNERKKTDLHRQRGCHGDALPAGGAQRQGA